MDKSRALIPWAVNTNFDWLLENISDEMPKHVLEELIAEARNQHTIKKEKAADIGTQIHEFAEMFGKFKLGECECPVIPEDAVVEVKNGITAFLDWYNKNEVEFIACEKFVYSKQFGYVGLVDAVAKINGEVYIVDYKSSKGIYNEMLYQVAGYKIAYNEEMDANVTKSIILKFGKEDGELEEREIPSENSDRDAETFLSLLQVKNREKENNRKK